MERAIELFANQGIGTTSVQQITEACGISKGAFYLAFKSKEDLILSIIDEFGKQFFLDVDRVVTSDQEVQEKLFQFYLTIFKFFEKHIDFGKMFIKEQHARMNLDLKKKMKLFNELLNKAILTLLRELYGENIVKKQYDLLVCIRSFIEGFSRICHIIHYPMDTEILARSLVEKTNILAKGSTSVFLDEKIMRYLQETEHLPITVGMIVSEINSCIDQEDQMDSLEYESLEVLKSQLTGENFSRAVIVGVMHNLKGDHFSWLHFLVNHYLKQNE